MRSRRRNPYYDIQGSFLSAIKKGEKALKPVSDKKINSQINKALKQEKSAAKMLNRMINVKTLKQSHKMATIMLNQDIKIQRQAVEKLREAAMETDPKIRNAAFEKARDWTKLHSLFSGNKIKLKKLEQVTDETFNKYIGLYTKSTPGKGEGGLYYAILKGLEKRGIDITDPNQFDAIFGQYTPEDLIKAAINIYGEQWYETLVYDSVGFIQSMLSKGSDIDETLSLIDDIY